MGLTIHFELAANVDSKSEARDLVDTLHAKALTMSFAEVDSPELLDEGETRELKEEVERVKYGGPAAFLSQASILAKNKELSKRFGQYDLYFVEPLCFYYFAVHPGEGSETALFGLARMPETVEEGGEQWSTGLARWHWQCSCKTQYASNPKLGGDDHFIRCHTGLVDLLDHANKLGILHSVLDESDFWETRDEAKLLASVQNLNRIVASVTGKFKDALGERRDQAVSPITDYPNFEHLEADQMKADEQ